MNFVALEGNIANDLEVKSFERNTSQGTVTRTFVPVTIANKNGVDANGDERTSFLHGVAYGKIGENLAKYRQKGDKILVQAELTPNNFTDKHGAKQYQYTFKCSSITYLDRAKKNTKTQQ